MKSQSIQASFTFHLGNKPPEIYLRTSCAWNSSTGAELQNEKVKGKNSDTWTLWNWRLQNSYKDAGRVLKLKCSGNSLSYEAGHKLISKQTWNLDLNQPKSTFWLLFPTSTHKLVPTPSQPPIPLTGFLPQRRHTRQCRPHRRSQRTQASPRHRHRHSRQKG